MLNLCFLHRCRTSVHHPNQKGISFESCLNSNKCILHYHNKDGTCCLLSNSQIYHYASDRLLTASEMLMHMGWGLVNTSCLENRIFDWPAKAPRGVKQPMPGNKPNTPKKVRPTRKRNRGSAQEDAAARDLAGNGTQICRLYFPQSASVLRGSYVCSKFRFT